MLRSSLGITCLTLLALGLSGCSFNSLKSIEQAVAPAAIHGNLHGGNQPVQNATVSVYAVGTAGYGSAPTLLASTTSDAEGNFSFSAGDYTCPQSDTPVYILAAGGNPGPGTNPSAALAASLASCTQARSAFVNLDEVTTAATAYALAQFFTTTLGSASTDGFGGPSSTTGSTVTYSRGLSSANSYTVPTLVDLPTGSANISNPAVTVEVAKLNTIANILASCVNTTGAISTTETTTACGKLFAATTPPGASTRPSDTLQAAVQMARFPYQNVSALLNLSPSAAPFAPYLAIANDWTLGVKYTTSSLSLTVHVGTTSNLEIDSSGNVWLPSTAPAGVAMFNPATNTFAGPYTTAGLTAPQNIAINSTGLVYAADLGSGLLAAFNPNGSSAGSFDTGKSNQGTVAIGPSGQIWLTASNALLGGTSIIELNGGVLSGTLTNLLGGLFTTNHFTTGITVAPNNDVYLSTTDSGNEYMEGFRQILPSVYLNSTLATYSSDGLGQIARNGSDFVSTTSVGAKLCSLALGCGSAGAAGMSAPQGVATDGDNNLWIANSASASISTLYGSANSFTPITTASYIHDSANGNTSVAPYGIAIDASGNVWTSNQTSGSNPYVLSELIGAAAPTITPLSAQIAGGSNRVGTRPNQ